MRIYNAAITGSSVECEVTAHNSPVAVMAWNQDASLLASASNKGTVLRVHKMPQVITTSRNQIWLLLLHQVKCTCCLLLSQPFSSVHGSTGEGS